MRKVIMSACAVLLGLLVCVSPIDDAVAQQNGPLHAVPSGKGPGFSGFNFVGPCLSYQALVWDALGIPSCDSAFAASGGAPISTTFKGNGNPAYLWQSYIATATHATAIDWAAQFSMTSSTGTPDSATNVRGAIYADCVASGTSGDCYGINVIGQASAGLSNATNVIASEINFNNNNSNRTSSCFEYNCSPGNGQYYGLVFGYGGIHLASAAIYITDLTAGGGWQRAIALGASAASRAVIEDQSNSTWGWLATGTKTIALDFGDATLTSFAYLPNNAPIWQKDTGGTLRNVIGLNSSNILVLGDSAINTFSQSNFIPTANNTYALGASGNQWTAIYTRAVNVYGSSSGNASIVAQATAGTPTLTLPNTSGTFAISASAPLSLSATTGNLTCSTCVTTLGSSDTQVIFNSSGSLAGSANLTWVSPALTIGVSGSATGLLKLTGATSGTVTVTAQATAGTATFTLPNASGTPAISVPSPLSLSATTGAVTWSGLTSGGVLYASGTTSVASSALLAANQIVVGGGVGVAPATLGSLGTTTTLLHGNAGGAPSFGSVVSADLNITTTTCTNQFVTSISSGGVGTCTTDTLASAQHANQGTTTTVLHGNAAGNPSWSAVSLTADITGTLALNNGGTNASLTASNGGVVYSTGSALAILSGTATANLPLLSGASTTPSWATITYPTSATSGGIPYFSSTTTMASSGALATGNILLGGGAGAAPTYATGCSITSGYNINCASSASFSPSWIVTNTAGDASSGSVTFQKTVSGGNTTNGTTFGSVVAQGYASSSLQNTAQFAAVQDGTSSGANVPSKWNFTTSSTGGQLNQTLTFDHAAHVYVTQAGTTTVGTCGTSPSLTGSDLTGTVTTGSTATTACTITFATAFASTPLCVVTGQDSGFGAMWVTPGTTTLVVNYASVTSKKFTYNCLGS